MTLKAKDFIEIEFTGRITDSGEVFDSNVKNELEKLHTGHDHPVDAEPFIFALEEGMFLKAIDDFFIGKPETPAEYEINLDPVNAFGLRNTKLIQTMPMRVFHEKNINPVAGITMDFDGRAGKILAVSGGRVIVDFNHSLAGKPVSYKIKLIKKVTDENKKINAVNKFFFGKEPKFKVENKKLILELDKQLAPLVPLFKDKYKEILNLDLDVEESKEKDQNNKKSQ